MKTIIYLILLILSSIGLFSQVNFDYKWSVKPDFIEGGIATANDVTIDNNGIVYTIGTFEKSAKFHFADTTIYLKSNGGYDIFISKHDSSGNYAGLFQLGGSLSESPLKIRVNPVNLNICLFGYASVAMDIDPTTNICAINPGGYIALYDSQLNLIKGYNFVQNNVTANTVLGFEFDNSGNLFIAGNFEYNGFDFDFSAATAFFSNSQSKGYIVKYDSNLNYLNAIKVGYTNNGTVSSMCLDNNANVYVTGTYAATQDFDPSTGVSNLVATTTWPNFNYKDCYLAKFTSNFNYIYALSTSSLFDEDGFGEITLDKSNNIFIQCRSTSDSIDVDLSGATRRAKGPMVIKYDNNGNLIYVKQISNNSSNYITPRFFTADTLGNIISIGSIYGVVDLDPSPTNIVNKGVSGNVRSYMLYLDNNGNFDTAYIYTQTNNLTLNALSFDGNLNKYYVVGNFAGNQNINPLTTAPSVLLKTYTTQNSGFLASYTGSTQTNWGFANGGCVPSNPNSDSCYFNSIAIGDNGSLYSLGTLKGDLDLNDDSTEYLLNTNYSINNNEIFIVKYDSIGKIVFAKGLEGTGTDKGAKINIDSDKNLIIAGKFLGTLDFDPSSLNAVNITGTNSVFIAKYDQNGNYILAKNIPVSVLYDVKLDNANNIIVVGRFSGTVDFDLSASIYSLTASPGPEIFIAKYDGNMNLKFAFKLKSSNYLDPLVVNTLDIGPNNEIYIGGSLTASYADFDPSSSTSNVIQNGSNGDIFIASYDSLGAYIMAKGIGGTGYDIITSLLVDENYNVYLVAQVNGYTDVDLGTGVLNVGLGLGTNKSYYVKYDSLFNLKYAHQSDYAPQTSKLNYKNDIICYGLSAFYSSQNNTLFTIDSLGVHERVVYPSSSFIPEIKTSMNGDCYLVTTTSTTHDADPTTGNSDIKTGTKMFIAKFNETPCSSLFTPRIVVTDSIICGPGRIDLSVDYTDTINSVRLHWMAITPTSTTISDSAHFSPYLSTSTTYYLKASGGCTDQSFVDSIRIIVNPLPTVQGSVSLATVCPGDSITVWGSGAVSYTVNGLPDSSRFIINSGQAFQIIGTNQFGCSDTALVSVSLGSSPSFLNISTTSPNGICPGASLYLVASTSSYSSVAWIQGITNYQMFYPTSSGYYTAIATNQFFPNCKRRDSIYVQILPVPFIQLSNDTTICAGQSVILNAVTNGATSGWSNGFVNGQTVTPTLGTTNYIFSSTSNVGCVNRDTMNVSLSECVWPGDADNNNFVNLYDMLELGLRYGAIGNARANISNNWAGYNCLDWGLDTITNGSNIKHADCNGNGIINYDDTLAVNLNFALSHTARPGSNLSINTIGDIYFNSSQQIYGPNEFVEIDVYAGTVTEPVQNFYGGVFYLYYPASSSIVPNSLSFNFSDASWIGNMATNEIKLVKDFESYYVIEAAICKIDHVNSSGYGKIGTIRFMTDYPESISTLNFSSDGADAIDSSGYYTWLTGSDYSITVSPSVGLQNQTSNSNISIYPNPNNGSFTLSNLNTREEYNLEVKDMLGRTVYTDVVKSNSSKVNIKLNQAAGVYWLQITSKQGGTEVHKVVVE